MRIVIYGGYAGACDWAELFPPKVEVETLAISSLKRTVERRADRFVYLDARGVEKGALHEAVAWIAGKPGVAWGVLDPDGAIEDPAALFFAGAGDYLGPGVLPASETRLRCALARAHRDDEVPEPEQARSFPGWAKLREGKEYDFLFCHAAIGEAERLREAIGEKRLAKLKEAFAAHMAEIAEGIDGKAWILDSHGLLLVFPPRDLSDSPVLAAFELLLDRALVGYEVFKLEVPLTFRFAFHAGRAPWRPPGSTGTVVSEDVNFIFHLANRGGHDGRITLSLSCADALLPQLSDIFLPAAAFEGHEILVSRRFLDQA
ncbi:MAG: hypothetical protein JXA15_04225 [Spirochaetales bacterium]|nr:hypothetical protein [Spirochaetales bacterium]